MVVEKVRTKIQTLLILERRVLQVKIKDPRPSKKVRLFSYINMFIEIMEQNKTLMPLAHMMKMLMDLKELEPTLSNLPRRVL
jgi:hypothetical protein